MEALAEALLFYEEDPLDVDPFEGRGRVLRREHEAAQEEARREAVEVYGRGGAGPSR